MNNNTNITRTWLTLLRTSNSIKKTVDQQLKRKFGVSISRFDILAILARSNRNGIRAGDLSKQLIVSDGNTTQIVSKLVKNGLVLRRVDPKDARAIIYSLSDEGVTLFTKMARAHQQWLQVAFEDMNGPDIEVLRNLLGHLQPHSQNTIKSTQEAL